MKRRDLTGGVFGLLTVEGFHSSDGKHIKWMCRCSCGVRTLVTSTNLVRGHSTKCRSHQRVPESSQRKIHPLYQTWKEMHRRCSDENSTNFLRYGAKGIFVCHEWSDFWRFVSDMGEKPASHYQIDRIDSSGSYCQANCRWVTPGENSRNRDFVKLNDETASTAKSMLLRGFSRKEIASNFGVSDDCIRDIELGRTWKHVGPSSEATPMADGVDPSLM